MKRTSTRVFIALVLGGLLTTAAFLGTFFWAGVSYNGTYDSPTENVETVWNQGPFEQELGKAEYLENKAGFPVEVTAGGKTLSGTITAATADSVTVKTASGATETMSTVDFESATISGYRYRKPDWGQKIFYFHVPVAEISFLLFGFAAYFSIRFIMTRRREFDTRSRIAMETTLMFVLLTMGTGILWTRAEWGVWWDWEPRLTTYFIMTLLVIGYFVLRNAVEDEERRALYAAAFSILGFIDAPISFFITRLVPSNHPVIEKGGLEGPMLVSFIVAQIGMLLVGYAVYQLRMGETLLRDRIEHAKTLLEG